MNQQKQTLAARYPAAFLTTETLEICTARAAALRATIAAKRAARAAQERIEHDLAEISPTAVVIPFPGVAR